MKKILALLVICAMLMTVLASCNLQDIINSFLPGKNCTEHIDADENGKCDVCGVAMTNSELPPACDEHVDEDGDGKCDNCEADVPKPPCEHVNENGDYNCDKCGEPVLEDVKYSLNVGDIDVGTRSESEINGKFTILSGTEVRNRTKSYDGVEYTKSVKMGDGGIRVSVPGAGTLKFIVQNGSSGEGAAVQYVKITGPDGTQQIEIPGTSSKSPMYLVELEVTEGNWLIQRVSGTIDVYYLELNCTVPVSPENGFELVSEGKVDFLVGETLNVSKINLNATFESGKTDPLSLDKVTIDTSAVDMSKAGVYEVVISYKDYDPIKFSVNVYEPTEIKFGFDAIEQLKSNSAGNSVYFNHNFKEVYGIGDTLDTKGLSVIVVGKCGDNTLEFLVDNYGIAGYNMTAPGAKTITISYGNISKDVTVYVVDTDPSVIDGVYQVMVDKSYTGDIGAVVDGYNMFNTVQQALDFLANAETAAEKVLKIGEGLYTEKLEITIPNLTIIGAGADKTVIEWDSLYGLVDAGGFTHTTDSTQTVAIRESAVNCRIEGVTISNYWNSQDRMDEAKLGIERGLALLVQADRFIMKDGALLGIQDTLELFTGRQYFENVFISGYTDFIFGTNNTTYFKNCTIHVIDTVKDDSGTAGYLTAFKGSNKDANDAIVYGAIFDGCRFTADEGVSAGKTAIGRTWGAYAAVAIINSEIGGHISVEGYDSSNKNKRYISMSGIAPTDETVQFVEYNNTGDGAISEAVAGMRMLTAEEAAKYADFSVIFGTVNGNISYLDPWDPLSGEIPADDRDYYYFTSETSATGTNHSFDTTTTIVSGSTLTWDGLLISAENGKVAWNANSGHLNMKQGAFIKFTVPAGATVTVKAYSAKYNHFTLNGVGTATDTLSQHYAEETEVTLLSTGDLYLAYIIINPNEEAPEEPTLTDIKVSGMKVDYMAGEELSLDGVSVNACYSDNSVRSLEYTVDTSAVNNAVGGEYAVVFTAGGKTVTVTVTFAEDLTVSESTTIDLSATNGVCFEGNKGNYKVLSIDATTGKFSDNNGGWVQVNAGTIITFNVLDGAQVSVSAYSSAANFDIAVANGVCTITAIANDYLSAITIAY